MSQCMIVEFKDGKLFRTAEFDDADGGARHIWESLLNEPLDASRDPGEWNEILTTLTKRGDLEDFELAALLATYERAVIKREHFTMLANHLRQFVDKYPAEGRPCHLSNWANYIESSDAEAIGFHHITSVDNFWYTYDDDDVITYYDLNAERDHFEVYPRVGAILLVRPLLDDPSLLEAMRQRTDEMACAILCLFNAWYPDAGERSPAVIGDLPMAVATKECTPKNAPRSSNMSAETN